MTASVSYHTWWLSSILVAICFTFYVFAEENESSANIVELEVGKLQGSTLTTAKGKNFLAYRGIPYAKPPINSLRFMPPQPLDGWQGLRNATTDGNVCPQIHLSTGEYIGDENCLFLNVYTPKVPKNEKEVKIPVMVWIHGGLFIGGSGSAEWYGPDYFLDEDIILVTVNYRLGALGFLSTGDQASPGNYGLKDQVMALKWVKDNINAFGGDPRRITIFGNDAGAASVHYHILSPMSKGLFHRAISQSGSALNPWAFTFNGPKSALHLAELLSCDLDEVSSHVVNCMRGHTPERIVTTTLRMKEWGTNFFNPFVPVAEGKGNNIFLASDPMKMINDGKVNKVKYIVGVNSHEGILPGALLLNDPQLWHDMKFEFHRYLPKYFGYDENSEKAKKIALKIKEFYFENRTLSSSLYNKFYEMEMDQKFLFGIYKTAKILNQGTFPKIFFYHFSYDGGIDFPSISLKNNVKGVNHGEELLYMFKAKLFPIDFKANTSQSKTSERIVKMWTNFATEGNPIPELTELLKIQWEPFSLKAKGYLDIGSELKMKEGLHNDRMELWDLINKILLEKKTVKDEL